MSLPSQVDAGSPPPRGRSAAALSPQLELALESFARTHRLTRRELDLLKLVVEGHTKVADIASCMGLSINTVHNHCKNIYRRTQTDSKASVLSRLVQFIVDSPEGDSLGVAALPVGHT